MSGNSVFVANRQRQIHNASTRCLTGAASDHLRGKTCRGSPEPSLPPSCGIVSALLLECAALCDRFHFPSLCRGPRSSPEVPQPDSPPRRGRHQNRCRNVEKGAGQGQRHARSHASPEADKTARPGDRFRHIKSFTIPGYSAGIAARRTRSDEENFERESSIDGARRPFVGGLLHADDNTT